MFYNYHSNSSLQQLLTSSNMKFLNQNGGRFFTLFLFNDFDKLITLINLNWIF